MDKYFSFNRKCLNLVGFSFLHQEIFVSGGVKRYLGLISGVLFILHNFSFAILNFKIAISIIPSPLVMSLICSQGAFKMFLFSLRQRRLWNLNMKISLLTSLISEKNLDKCIFDLKKNSRIVRSAWISTFCGNTLVNVIPFVLLVFHYFTDGIIYKKLQYSFSLPFDPYDGYFTFTFVYIYQILLSTCYATTLFSLDGFVMLTLGKLAILFKCLGEDLHEIIDEYDQKDEKKTIKRLNEKIDMHNRLIELTNEFLSLIQIAMLIYSISFFGHLCIIIYNAVIGEITLSFIVRRVIGFFQIVALLHHVCYFGEKLTENVSFEKICFDCKNL